MSTTKRKAGPPQQTEHPYIIRAEGVCGGRPVIKGTRISVRHIAELYKRGDTIDDILKGYPHLSGAAVHDAISYYLDHQEEIEREIVKNRLETVMTKAGLEIEKRGFLRLPSDPLPK